MMNYGGVMYKVYAIASTFFTVIAGALLVVLYIMFS